MVSFVAFAQNKEGYWDNMRSTNITVVLGAGEKKLVKTNNFPEGTTELVFRISLLNDNQKITTSLVSVLKAIPDPTGISQGSAGAVLLLSTLTGEDKCKYTVFNHEKDAKQLLVSGKVKNACMVQETPVNRDARLLSAESDCVSNLGGNLWFVFESDNWVMKEKIVLEVVPWVSYKASRGWDSKEKSEVVTLCRGLEIMPFLENKDLFCGAFLDEICAMYSYQEFKKLLPEEKAKIIKEVSEKTLKATGEDKVVLNQIRDEAILLFNNHKYQKAIDLINKKILTSSGVSADDYNLVGKYYLLTNQFEKALESFEKAQQIQPSNLGTQLNLAYVYMFKDQFKKAREIHKTNKNQNISAEISWKQQVYSDFELFKKYGLPTRDFEKTLRVIE